MLNIGVLVALKAEPEEEIGKVADLGLRSCQVCSWKPEVWTEQTGRRLVEAAGRRGVNISTFWSGYPGPAVWNFVDGPGTIGLVPPQHRAMRVEALKKAAEFAARIQLSSITTHVGFIPENPRDPEFAGTVDAIREVASRCKALGIEFRFETGQETPGINLDTANVILYGKGNPVDALDVFGSYVRDLHIKDGLFPTDGTHLGRETPLGEGKVDFVTVIRKLKAIGYTGPLTIEREISGEKQIADIRRAIEMLQPLC